MNLRTFAGDNNSGVSPEVLAALAEANGGHAVAYGDKLLPVPTTDGKLTVDLIETKMAGIGDQHHVQPKVIALTQSTEVGTVYDVKELEKIGSKVTVFF